MGIVISSILSISSFMAFQNTWISEQSQKYVYVWTKAGYSITIDRADRLDTQP